MPFSTLMFASVIHASCLVAMQIVKILLLCHLFVLLSPSGTGIACRMLLLLALLLMLLNVI